MNPYHDPETHRRDRRLFLQSMAAAAAALPASTLLHRASAQESDGSAPRESPGERVVLGIMGVNGRGSALARGMMAQPNTEVAYICDVDSRAAGRAGALVGEVQERKPDVVNDFRRILDDAGVDALVVAAPNHWHAPATILGCSAGKHVYVEKPCSHTPEEGELAVAGCTKKQTDRADGNSTSVLDGDCRS